MGHIAPIHIANLRSYMTKSILLGDRLQHHVLDGENGLDLQAFDSPLTSRLQRLGASLLMGVVSRRLSPLRGLRDGDRDLGILLVPYRGGSTKAACSLPHVLSGNRTQKHDHQHNHGQDRMRCRVSTYCLEYCSTLGCGRLLPDGLRSVCTAFYLPSRRTVCEALAGESHKLHCPNLCKRLTSRECFGGKRV